MSKHQRSETLTFIEYSMFETFRSKIIEKQSKHHKNGHVENITFIGKDAVSVMCELFSLSRSEAEKLGQQFMKQGFFIHVKHRHQFRDKDYEYQFTNFHKMMNEWEEMKKGRNVHQMKGQTYFYHSQNNLFGFNLEACLIGSNISKMVESVCKISETFEFGQYLQMRKSVNEKKDAPKPKKHENKSSNQVVTVYKNIHRNFDNLRNSKSIKNFQLLKIKFISDDIENFNFEDDFEDLTQEEV